MDSRWSQLYLIIPGCAWYYSVLLYGIYLSVLDIPKSVVAL